LRGLRKEVQALVSKQQDINDHIAEIQRTIAGLAALPGDKS